MALIAYVTQNPGTQQITLFGWQWAAVPDWLPVAVATGGMFLLMLLYHGLVGVPPGMRHWDVRRQVGDREAAAAGLRDENERLRAENEQLRGRA